jgi:hypothetical protein
MYRKSHVINPASGAGTNYQVCIIAHYGSGTDSGADVYLNGKCRSDFGDVRFTRSDCVTLLDDWMETKVDGDYAVFWVEVADDLSTNPVTIYIYYGNPNATTTSNGDATFLFFDHFDTLDTAKWTTYGSPSVSNSILTVLAANNAYVWSNISFAPPFAVRCKWRNSVSNTDGAGLQLDNGNKTWDNPPDFSCTAGWYNQTQFTIDGLGSLRQGIGLALDTNFHVWDVKVKSGNVSTLTDGAYPMSRTGTTASAYNLWLKAWVYNLSGAKGEFDWILVRKFTDPEPSHGSWGSEETAVIERAVNVSNESVNPTSGSVGDSVTYQATVLDSAGEPLPSSFVADLVMDSIVLVNDKAFTSDVYNPSNGLLTLQFTVPDVFGTRTVRLDALLTDNNGNPLAGKMLTFKHKLSSESSWTTIATRITGNDGKASLTIDVEANEYHDFRVEFAGDSMYEASYDEELNVYVGTRTRSVKLEALLTDDVGNPLEGKTLTFKHKLSSEQSWTTDGTQVTGSDGKASLTIDVGTHEYYDFRVEFAGDSTYEASYDEELNVYIAPKTNYTVKLVWLEQTI